MDDQRDGTFVSWPDLRRLGALVIGAGASRLWPQRWDALLAEVWFRAYRAAAGATLDQLAAHMRSHLAPEASEQSCRAWAEHHVRSRIEDMWGRVRGVRRRGWRPSIAMEGLDRVERALGRGRGALIWAMRVGSATALKQGFWESGLPLTHLSRADHGSLSTTRLGLSVVAPLYRRAEDAFLHERVQIPLGGSLAYLRVLASRLAENRCVSIFAEHAGRQNVEAAVLGMPRRFALGAPSIAWRERAALLTAYVLREGAFRYRVVVEEEIPVDSELERKRFAEHAVQELARRLESCIRRHPGDWHGWFTLERAS